MPKTAPKSNDDQRRGGGGRKRKLETAERRPRQAPKRVSNYDGRPHRPVPETPPAVIVTSTTPDPSPSNGRVTDFMLQALGRIRELQDELDFLQNDPYAEDTDDDHEDGGDGHDDADDDDDDDGAQHHPAGLIGGRRAEAIGWAVCARETMHFLQREGIPPDSPLMMNLRRRLIGRDGPVESHSC